MPFSEVASHNGVIALTELLSLDHSDESMFHSVISLLKSLLIVLTHGQKSLAHSTRSCFCKGVSNRGIHRADTFPMCKW